MDILPDELTAYIQAFKSHSSVGGAVLPVLPTEPAGLEPPQNENEIKEDAHEEKE
jgi:hypothetical protein